MSAPRVRFLGVGKRFLKGESATALRDLIPGLIRRLRGVRRQDDREFWALDDLCFEVGEGEILGIIGRNGGGKSTTLKLAAGILRANRGTVEVDGSVSALIEVAAGFHPDLTGRENIFLNGSILGLSRRVIRERVDEIIEFAELRPFIDTPVKRYSTGMYMRLGFAVAVHVDPDILLIDEVLAVGDLAFRQKCLRRIRELKESDKTILFVSHKMDDVRGICDRVLYLHEGKVIGEGAALDVTRQYEADMKEKSLVDVLGMPRSQRGSHAGFRIVGVETLNAKGKATEVVRSGDALRVRVECEVPERIDEPILSVSLLRSDNVRVCHVSTWSVGPRVEALGGACEFELLFERLDLADDFYSIETVVWDTEMSAPIAQHLNPTIQVVGSAVPLNRPGVYQPPARFTRIVSDGKAVLDRP